MAQLDQIAHHRVGFLGVACTIVEHVAIGRIAAQDVGPGERTEEQRLLLQRVGDRDLGGRRPRSRAAPENGRTIPNLISLSVAPCTAEAGAAAAGGSGAVGAVAAAAEEGPITPDRLELLPRPSDFSRLENCRSAVLQSILPKLTTLRPSAMLRSNARCSSTRSGSCGDASRITA